GSCTTRVAGPASATSPFARTSCSPDGTGTSPPDASMLEAHHLVKRFFGITVVDDVSFSVRRGEVVGYLGPNGSGKSTTAKMCTGLIEWSAGSVRCDGR